MKRQESAIQLQKAIELISNGLTVKQAAEQIGAVYKTLLNNLRRAGFNLNDCDARRKKTEMTDAEIAHLYSTKAADIAQIMSMTGLSRAAVYYKLQKQNAVPKRTKIDKTLVYDLLVSGYAVSEIARKLSTDESISTSSIRSVIHRMNIKTADFKRARNQRRLEENRNRLMNG